MEQLLADAPLDDWLVDAVDQASLARPARRTTQSPASDGKDQLCHRLRHRRHNHRELSPTLRNSPTTPCRRRGRQGRPRHDACGPAAVAGPRCCPGIHPGGVHDARGLSHRHRNQPGDADPDLVRTGDRRPLVGAAGLTGKPHPLADRPAKHRTQPVRARQGRGPGAARERVVPPAGEMGLDEVPVDGGRRRSCAAPTSRSRSPLPHPRSRAPSRSPHRHPQGSGRCRRRWSAIPSAPANAPRACARCTGGTRRGPVPSTFSSKSSAMWS